MDFQIFVKGDQFNQIVSDYSEILNQTISDSHKQMQSYLQGEISNFAKSLVDELEHKFASQKLSFQLEMEKQKMSIVDILQTTPKIILEENKEPNK